VPSFPTPQMPRKCSASSPLPTANDYAPQAPAQSPCTSAYFRAANHRGTMISHQVELIVGTLRLSARASQRPRSSWCGLDGILARTSLIRRTSKAGQGAKAWINSSTCLARQQFLQCVAWPGHVQQHGRSRWYPGICPPAQLTQCSCPLCPSTHSRKMRRKALEYLDAGPCLPVAMRRTV
jgi:hypothetical protein